MLLTVGLKVATTLPFTRIFSLSFLLSYIYILIGVIIKSV